jgi:cytidylate kinase
MGSVTISASFGSRGDRIGHGVADRLGLVFLDRAIPRAAARTLNLSDLSAESLDERAPGRFDRLLRSLSLPGSGDLSRDPIEASHPFSSAEESAVEPTVSANAFRLATEKVLREIADTTGAVILGRAGMMVLGGRPDVLCVRLDGPVEERIARSTANGTDIATVRQTQKQVDGAREQYAHYFYKVSQRDVRLYHLYLDTCALPTEACIDLVVAAAKARFSGEPSA